MSISLILLSVVSALLLFGAAQRVLDRMQLTDRAVLVIAALIFFGGLIPDIRLGNVVFNIGGFVVPLGVCIWLLVKTDTRTEVRRSLFGSVLTGAAVYLLGRLLPSEPEKMLIDPNYLYGIAGGIIAYVLGRSRRAAFICGILGVILADTAVALINWRQGIRAKLFLGVTGAMDTIVISGLLAVLLEFGTYTNDKEDVLASTGYMADVMNKTLYGGVKGAAEGKAKENAGAWKGIGWLLTALVIGALIFAFVATGSGKEAFSKWKRTFREMTAMPENKEKK